MKIEVRPYTYEEMPDYCDSVEGAGELVMTGEEISLEYIPDVVYDHRDGVDLRLQIIRPVAFDGAGKKYPCVVFIQGSAWMKQNIYCNVPNLGKLASRGYVTAIVEYRHSGIAKFPAQIIDGKNAIRFLRAHCEEYSVDPEQMIIMGDSSGGHTSALIGMTANTDLLDDPINGQSCRVDGIIDLYGAVDVTLPYGFPTTENHQKADSPEGMLMGFDISRNPVLAEQANAKSYVQQTFAPMLILHGTKDRIVFCQESVDLYEACRDAGKDVSFYFVRNADHASPVFWTEEAVELYHRFIQRCLRKQDGKRRKENAG